MPRKTDQRKLLDRLIQDHEAELMPNEINEILEAELSKPAEEMDAQLVNRLLDLLGEEEPTAADKEACWQSIQGKRNARARRRSKPVLRRIAAAAAVLVVLFVVSFETAKAFRWTFLLKLLAPVAETFGIYSTGTLETEAPVNDAALLIEDTGYEQTTYADPDQMPGELGGYKVIPAWVPERFAFIQGNIYEDPDMAHGSLFYQDFEDYLCVDTYIYYNDEAIFGFEYERTLSEPQNKDVNGLSVSFYQNNEADGVLAASWIDEEAHYHIEGNLTEDELSQVVGSFAE